jgi:dimethylglycine dehydrogenase
MCRTAENHFFLVGTYAAEVYYLRWFEQHLGAFAGRVHIRPCAMEYTGLSVAGPNSRELLQSLTDTDLSTAAFPFMSFAQMDIGHVPALVGRVSFTGELGYEMWVTSDYQRALYDSLMAAGQSLGIRPIGGRALNSMRLEKSFGSWAREVRPIYGAFEANLGRFVDLKRGGFIGAAAAAAEQASGGVRKLIALDVAAVDADAIGDEPIWHDGAVVGWVTSGGYGHRTGKSIALGYVNKDVAEAVAGFEVEIIGQRLAATRLGAPAFDPTGQRMRS